MPCCTKSNLYVWKEEKKKNEKKKRQKVHKSVYRPQQSMEIVCATSANGDQYDRSSPIRFVASARIHLKFINFRQTTEYGKINVRIKLALLRPFLSSSFHLHFGAHFSFSLLLTQQQFVFTNIHQYLPTTNYAKGILLFRLHHLSTSETKTNAKSSREKNKIEISSYAIDHIRSNSTRSMNFWLSDEQIFCFLFWCVQSAAIDDDDDYDAWRWVTANDNIVNGFMHELMWIAATGTEKENSFRKLLLLLLSVGQNENTSIKFAPSEPEMIIPRCNCSINMPFSLTIERWQQREKKKQNEPPAARKIRSSSSDQERGTKKRQYN